MAQAYPSSESAWRGHLLLVDADARARSALAVFLRENAYRVDEVSKGAEACARIQTTPYDLLVLETGLPDLPGIQVMQRVRQMRRDLPLLVLTAHASLETAIAAVKAEALDYICKPCNENDLLLTISRALAERAQEQRHQRLLSMVSQAMEALREPQSGGELLPESEPTAPPTPMPVPLSAADLLDVGPLALDREKRLVMLKTDPPRTVELTEGETSILLALMEKPNQVFSYSQLAKVALGYDGMDKWTVESVVRSSVFRLRHKIEPEPDGPRLICTVRGRGYYFSPA